MAFVIVQLLLNLLALWPLVLALVLVPLAIIALVFVLLPTRYFDWIIELHDRNTFIICRPTQIRLFTGRPPYTHIHCDATIQAEWHPEQEPNFATRMKNGWLMIKDSDERAEVYRMT